MARRQQPPLGLRRRRRTSDPGTEVNHVSSTTSLGTGGGRESRGVPGGERARAAGTRGLRLRAAGSWPRSLGSPAVAAPGSGGCRAYPRRAPRSRRARPERAPGGRSSRSCRCSGGARLRRVGPGPLPALRVAAAAPAPTRGGGLEPGLRTRARGGRRRRGWIPERSGRAAGRPGTRAGTGCRVPRAGVMGPAEEERARGAGSTSQPGRESLGTPSRREAQPARGARLCPALASPGPPGPPGPLGPRPPLARWRVARVRVQDLVVKLGCGSVGSDPRSRRVRCEVS